MNKKLARTTDQIRASILQIANDLKTHLVDMDEAIDALILGLVAAQNVCLLGLPGLAKTLVVERLSQAISDSHFFYRNLDDSTMPSQLFGGLDAKELMSTGHEVHMTDGFLPDANIVALDEGFKCNSMSLNALLPALNERVFVNDGKVVKCANELVVVMSNEYPRKGLDALWDRFPIRVWCEDPQGADSFAKLWEVESLPVTPRVSLEELRRIRSEVAAVDLGGGHGDVAKTCFKIRAELGNQGIRVSPRRVKVTQKILKAKAWLDGATAAESAHCEVLNSVYWDHHDQRGAVQKAVSNHVVNETSDMDRRYRAALVLINKVPENPPSDEAGGRDWRNEAGAASREVKRACDLISADMNKAKSDRARDYGSQLINKLTSEAAPMRQALRDSLGA